MHQLQMYQIEMETQNAELRMSQAELERSLERYSVLFDAAPVGYLILDLDLRIVDANQAAVALLGLAAAVLRGKPLESFIDPDDTADVLSAFRRTKMGSDAEQVESRLRTMKPGPPAVVRLDISPDRLGASLRVTLFDVTRIRELERSAENAARLLRDTISADLHDGLGQELAGLNLSIAAIRQRVGRGEIIADKEFVRLSTIIGLAIESCRQIVRGLSPISEYDGGLLLALRHLFERAEIPDGPKLAFSVIERATVRLSTEVADHLYRICQEALSNALKHSHAKFISLNIVVKRQAISIEMVDDGLGFDLAMAEGSGFGLGVMRHRATAAHIRFSQQSSPGAGTTLRLLCLQPPGDG